MTATEFMCQFKPVERPLFAFALKLTQNQEDAKDLCQETLMRAFANKEKFRVNTNFKAWLTTIMRNKFINQYRRSRSHIKMEQEVEGNLAYPINHTVYNEGSTMLMLDEFDQMFSAITPDQRTPFEMFFEGYQYKEISETLGMPIGTVKSRIFFARKKMKDIIRRYYGTVDFRRA
ncbi:MAG: RNA polymerase sigma factor [Saprospiraceae bacterium]|nr:RNA polymerase sigma factor [Saprospiraceae bacterium]MCF8250495.1 RNA polymerase sigma factor [Saprospiraceae bacterium]MCF8279635.1 RNA polymerase sigma factor [Bacteroidales bacterium]MCF8312421.1 RNA polymerase sigma factor [Saprospiraceae bacterium]MCF8440762.1 RNA polymerase sigma factor [Saprospiraceae bacterium]